MTENPGQPTGAGSPPPEYIPSSQATPHEAPGYQPPAEYGQPPAETAAPAAPVEYGASGQPFGSGEPDRSAMPPAAPMPPTAPTPPEFQQAPAAPTAPQFEQPPAASYPPPGASGNPPYGGAGNYAAPTPPPTAEPAHGSAGHAMGGFDARSLQSFDPKTVNPLDWGIIAAGLVAFIFSTVSFFSYSVSVAGFSSTGTVSAWHGFFAPVAILLALLASALLAVQVIAKLELPIPVRLVVLGAYGVALLFLLLALFVIPGNTGGVNSLAIGVKINKGHGFGYWICLLAVLAGTGLAAKRFTDTGGKLPVRS
jgi:hypothetical protein